MKVKNVMLYFNDSIAVFVLVCVEERKQIEGSLNMEDIMLQFQITAVFPGLPIGHHVRMIQRTALCPLEGGP
jgi:hypothetical protein